MACASFDHLLIVNFFIGAWRGFNTLASSVPVPSMLVFETSGGHHEICSASPLVYSVGYLYGVYIGLTLVFCSKFLMPLSAVKVLALKFAAFL